MSDLVIRSRRVVLKGDIVPAAVYVTNGKIDRIADWNDVDGAGTLDDHRDLVVMPGLVDAHVHVNEPGRTEWEGYETATRAAAAGGVTTIVDMPLNSIPPTTTLAGFEEKVAAAQGKCTIDVAFWGGVVPGNTAELAPLIKRGVRGFKCFLIHSGVDEFPHVTEDDLRIAMPEIARLGSVLLVHAEVAGPIDAVAEVVARMDHKEYATFLRSRPPEAELDAIELMVRLCRETGCRVHIVHHSAAEALPLLRAAKAERLPLTVETCPHYLTFAAEDIPDGATQFKCCPPVRTRANREALWQGLADGAIDMVVSDHSPCTPHLKLQDSGDLLEAWGGIASLQFGLPVMWTNLRSRGFAMINLARLMCERPAKLAGLGDRKGRIAEGLDAEIVVWDPDERFTVTADIIEHRHKLTPYDGLELSGKTKVVYSNGRKIFDKGSFTGGSGGRLILASR
jgi:allantoinase